MADKTTNWTLKLTDLVSGPMSRITSTTGSATTRVKQLTDLYDKLGTVSSVASRSLGDAPGARGASGMLDGLNQRIEKLNRLRASAPNERWLTKFNDTLSKSQREVQRLNSLTGNVPVQRVTGKIEQLSLRLEHLRTKQVQAFDTQHIVRYNRMIESTQKDIDKLSRMGNSGKGAGGFGAASLMGAFGPYMGVGALVAGATAGIKTVAQTTAKYEQIGVGFEVMLGSKTKADKMVSDLIAYANKSPLRSEDIFQSTQTLLGFGVAAEKILPYEKMLGDVSQGNAEKFNGLSLAFAQTQAAGKLMGQDLLQYISQGFNPLQELGKMTGRSMGQLRADMEKGAISAQMVEKAFTVATSAGGRFYNMANKQAETLGGRWSTLSDSADMLSLAVGERLKPAFGGLLGVASSVVGKLTEFVKVPLIQKLEDEKFHVNSLVTALSRHNLSAALRNKLYDELKEIKPEILKGIDKENILYDKLRLNVSQYNDEVRRSVGLEMQREKLRPFEEKVFNLQTKIDNTANKLSDLFTAAATYSSNPDKIYSIVNNTNFPDDQKIRIVQSMIANEKGPNYSKLTSVNNQLSDLMSQNYYIFNTSLPRLYKDLNTAQEKLNQQRDITNKAINNLYGKTNISDSTYKAVTPGADDTKKTTTVTEDLDRATTLKTPDNNNVNTNTTWRPPMAMPGEKKVTLNLTVHQTNNLQGVGKEELDKVRRDLVSIIVDAAGDGAASW